MEYIYQEDFTYFPTSLDQIVAARSERDTYTATTLDLINNFIYTKSVFELFNTHTYTVWENFDKVYCQKAAEWYCYTKMTNSSKIHNLLVANGNVLYCRENQPTADEINSIYTKFMEWNGAGAAGSVGGYPFRIYSIKYIPSFEYSDESEVEEPVAWPTTIPPPPQSSPKLRRSERLAKKNVRRCERLSKLPRVDYSE